MPAPTLSIQALRRILAATDDDALAILLRARPDLLRPAPGDFTGLAVRVQSEASLRQVLHRLDAGTLAGLVAVVGGAAQVPPVSDELRAHLRDLGVLFPSYVPTDAAITDDATSDDAVPGSLPALLEELEVPAAVADVTPGAAAPMPQAPAQTPTQASTQAPAQATAQEPTTPAPAPMPALVRNAAVAAIAELLADIEHLLELLGDSPAATLRTGGVGMRELRRLTSTRTGSRRPSDAEVGETGWLLELAAAAALICLDVDTGTWRTTETSTRWRTADRSRRHQLLVSGWLLCPRSPLLLRGPHPRARIAPALTQERSRGDAPRLRRRLMERAAELTAGTAPSPLLYQICAPDEDTLVTQDVTEESLAASLTGPVADRLHWERPLAGPRTTHLLPGIIAEAERLGLLALGTVTSVGCALHPLSDTPSSDSPHLTAMAEHLAQLLPPPAERVHVQSDLTLMPTGTPSPTLAQGLIALADRETHGPVPTFRLTSASLHRALDAGWSPAQVRDFLTAHSTAALPSPLTTLLEDAARSWPGVEIGAAGSWIREADPQIRAELLEHAGLRHLQLHPLTEEVLISPADPGELARGLSAAGFGTREEHSEEHSPLPTRHTRRTRRTASPTPSTPPALPDDAWTLTSSPWQQAPVRTLHTAPVSTDQAHQAVQQLRAGIPPRPGDPTVSLGADVVGLLRTAVRERRGVIVRRVDAHGIEHRTEGIPQALDAGRLRLRSGAEEMVLPIHRITGVTLPQRPEDDEENGNPADAEASTERRPTARTPLRTTGRRP